MRPSAAPHAVPDTTLPASIPEAISFAMLTHARGPTFSLSSRHARRLGRTLAYVHPPAPAPCPFACFQVMADSRLRAEAEPLRLSRNWFVAVVISLLWLAGLEYCLYLGINTWGG